MKTVARFLLIFALCLLLAGAALFVGVLAKNDWSFSALGGGEYVTRTVEITGAFRSISIQGDTEEISFLPSEDGSCRVEFTEREKEPHSAVVEDGTLRIEQQETGSWLDHISFFSFKGPKITVRLPETEYAALSVAVDTGKVEIPADFRFETVSVSADTGDVCCSASVAGELQIGTDTGNIRLEGLSAGTLKLSASTGRVELSAVRCPGEVEIGVSTGKTLLTDLSCGSLNAVGSTGDLNMKNVTAEGLLCAKRSTGDIRLEACDAAELELETDTGDVKGSLRSEKVFITRSDTGRIRVPETVTGGKCKITTETGNIEIRIN